MARYRIVCTLQQPADQPPTHAHIVEVGTGSDPNRGDNRWTLSQVLTAMDRGDTFYTRGVQSGRVVDVMKFWCEHCRRNFIRSAADAIYDNNLDSLRRCNF